MSPAAIQSRSRELFVQSLQQVYRKTDRLFAGLMLAQWVAAMLAAVWLTPRTWIGATSSVHLHVWLAVFFGGLLAIYPVYLAWRCPGRALTRHVIAVSQMLFSTLFIHLSGGRIETHFHVFGSLAFLAMYRDWRVLLTATVIVACDHFLRGEFWPQSVFGVATLDHWRWLEHAGWVLFEDIFLLISIRQSLQEMQEVAHRRAELENINTRVESQVAERTHELRAEQELLQSLMNNLPDFIFFKDTGSRFTRINQSMAEFFSLAAPEQCVGKSDADFFPLEAAAQKIQEERRIFQTGEAIVDQVEKVELAQGTIWLAVTKVPIRDAAGKITGLVGISRNITQQEQTQHALQQSNEQLETATARANEMALKAEMSNIAKSHFLANMSHEIRTPINGILGMTTLLMQSKLDPEQQQFTQLLKRSGESLLALINDILDFSKIEAQKLQLEKLPFNLRETMEDATELLAFKAAEKKIDLACLIPPEVPVNLCGDALRIRQILVNLAGNAIKFTSAGSVIMHVELQSEDATVATIKFHIKDTGIGIPKDRQHLLFNSFSQVDSSTTRKFGGTGLGLAISKQLSEMMGGSIGVESEPGNGTEFWFTIRVEKQTRLESRPAPLADVSVLVVEHHPEVRRSITQTLQAAGCHPVEAAGLDDAGQALAQRTADGEPANIVLLSRHDGPAEKAFISQIKAGSRHGVIKLIRLAPFGTRANPEDLAAGGFSAQLNVPFRLSQLSDCLSRVLNQTDDRPVFVADAAENKPGCGLKILVVDDNETNLIVVSKILEKLGHLPTNAASGAEALAALKQPGFDLVLMDCQMPEMDGYEATRRIRAGECGEAAKAIPIVALTANVYASDQQLCLEAGMDEYLCKPIRMDKLKAVLAHYQKKQAEASPVKTSLTTSPTATSTSGSISLPTGKLVLNLTDLMDRMLDDMEMARSTAEAFLSDLPGQIAAVKKAVQSGDPVATAAAAHRLRGSAGTIGGDALHQILTDIEHSAKLKKMAEAAQSAALIDLEAERLARELTEQIINAPVDPAGVPFPA